MKTILFVALISLSGCATMEMNELREQTQTSFADSIYLQHPQSGLVAECNLPGSGFFSFTFSMGHGEQAMQASCVHKWQARGFIPGNHDALKAIVTADPTREAKSN